MGREREGGLWRGREAEGGQSTGLVCTSERRSKRGACKRSWINRANYDNRVGRVGGGMKICVVTCGVWAE